MPLAIRRRGFLVVFVLSLFGPMVLAAPARSGDEFQFEKVAAPAVASAVFEHLTFQFGENRLWMNPDSLNEHRRYRRAVAYALDRAAIAAAVGGALIDSYVDAFNPAWSQQPWSQYDYNPVKARALIRRLCADLGRDCVADPPRAVFTTTSNNDARVKLSELLVDMFADIGIDYENMLQDSQIFFGETLDFGLWDVGEWAWVGQADMGELVAFHAVFDPHSPPPGGLNLYRLGTPAVSGQVIPGFNQGPSSVRNAATRRLAELVDLMNSTGDFNQRLGYVHEAEQIMADHAFIIPLYIRGGCNGLAPTIVGTLGNDNLTGTPGDDVIVGFAGNDVIEGMGGNDVICGGPGRDKLFGGAGRDVLLGEGGNDRLAGGAGNDVIYPGRGVDHVSGGSGSRDWVNYSPAAARVVVSLRAGFGAGQGRDTLVSIESIVGSAFNDRLIGNSRSNQIVGGAGPDAVWGLGGDDFMWGNAGRDVLKGGSGSDVAKGGTGADTCIAEVQVSC